MISLKHGYKVKTQEDTTLYINGLPMADFVVMQIAESIEGLAHDACGLCFGQMLLLSDEEEKFTTFTQPKY